MLQPPRLLAIWVEFGEDGMRDPDTALTRSGIDYACMESGVIEGQS